MLAIRRSYMAESVDVCSHYRWLEVPIDDLLVAEWTPVTEVPMHSRQQLLTYEFAIDNIPSVISSGLFSNLYLPCCGSPLSKSVGTNPGATASISAASLTPLCQFSPKLSACCEALSFVLAHSSSSLLKGPSRLPTYPTQRLSSRFLEASSPKSRWNLISQTFLCITYLTMTNVSIRFLTCEVSTHSKPVF